MRKNLTEQASTDSWFFSLSNNSLKEDIQTSSNAFESKNFMDKKYTHSLSKKFLSENIKNHRLLNSHQYPYTVYKSLRDSDDEQTVLDDHKKKSELYYFNR